MIVSTIPFRWSQKTEKIVRDAYPTLSSPVIIYVVWYLSKNPEAKTEEVAVAAGRVGFKNFKPIHLSHAKRTLAGNKTGVSSKKKTKPRKAKLNRNSTIIKQSGYDLSSIQKFAQHHREQAEKLEQAANLISQVIKSEVLSR